MPFNSELYDQDNFYDAFLADLRIDDNILWEGSLNILSQNDSCEFMRRINSLTHTQDTLRFVGQFIKH